MADSRAITIQAGQLQQIDDADLVIVGQGIATAAGSGLDLVLQPDGGAVLVIGHVEAAAFELPTEGTVSWPFFDTPLRWQIVSGHATFGGITDDTLNIGSNVGPAGARIDPTKHSIGIQIEHRYNAGLIEWAEQMFRYVSAAGVERRPVGCQVNLATNVAITSICADEVYFNASNMTTQLSKLLSSGWLFYGQALQFVDTVANPLLIQASCNLPGVSGQPLTVRAQQNVNVTGTGGHLVLEAGGGGAADGWVRIGGQLSGYGIDVRPAEVAITRFCSMSSTAVVGGTVMLGSETLRVIGDQRFDHLNDIRWTDGDGFPLWSIGDSHFDFGPDRCVSLGIGYNVRGTGQYDPTKTSWAQGMEVNYHTGPFIWDEWWVQYSSVAAAITRRPLCAGHDRVADKSGVLVCGYLTVNDTANTATQFEVDEVGAKISMHGVVYINHVGGGTLAKVNDGPLVTNRWMSLWMPLYFAQQTAPLAWLDSLSTGFVQVATDANDNLCIGTADASFGIPLPPRCANGIKHGAAVCEMGPGAAAPVNVQALGADKVLVATADAQIQILTSAVARNVDTPSNTLTGLYYWIESRGDGVLTVRDAGGATVTTLSRGQGCWVKATGASWVAYGMSASEQTLPVLVEKTTAEAIAAGAPVAVFNNGGAAAAEEGGASAAAGARVNFIGLAQAGVGAPATVSVVVAGECDVPDAQWAGGVPLVANVGALAYVSTTTGSLTLTPPAGAGETVQPVGRVSRGGAGAVKVLVEPGCATLIAP